MHGVKRILIAIGLASLMWAAAASVVAREEPVQPCPVLKVSVTEFPTNERLLMHPAPESGYSVPGSLPYAVDRTKRQGIRVAVLWENRTGETLRNVTLRLEYQQAKTGVIRTAEQQFPEVPIKGRWTHFDLSGAEFEDTVHVAAWRVTVNSSGRVLGSRHSAMWSAR